MPKHALQVSSPLFINATVPILYFFPLWQIDVFSDAGISPDYRGGAHTAVTDFPTSGVNVAPTAWHASYTAGYSTVKNLQLGLRSDDVIFTWLSIT